MILKMSNFQVDIELPKAIEKYIKSNLFFNFSSLIGASIALKQKR